MVLPTYLYRGSGGSQVLPIPDKKATVLGQQGQWCYFGEKKTIKVPNFFSEEPTLWDGNDVCHIKCTSVMPSMRDYPDNKEFLGYGFMGPNPYWWSIYASHPRYDRRVEITLYQEPDSLGLIVYYTDVISPSSSDYRYRYQNWYLKRTFNKVTGWSDRYVYGDPPTAIKILMKIGMDQVGQMPYHIPDPEECMSYLKKIVSEVGPALEQEPTTYSSYWPSTVSKSYVQQYYICQEATPLPPSPTMLAFDEYFLTRTGWSDQPYAAYHLKAAMQKAYLDALDHVPQLNENSIANVLELISFIKALVVDHRIEIPKSLQSAWLSYRYSYTTTKLDTEEAISFVHRHVDQTFLEQGFSCYGQSVINYNDVTAVVRCSLEMKSKELSYLDKIWTALYRYGLSPSFYMVWDMIPYSFIVDWFIPVGDILSGLDKTRMYDRTYDISNIWYSLKYNMDRDGVFYSAYTRWASSSPPEFQGYYTLEYKGPPSTKVLGYRILDTLSLTIK